ncbi:glycoside hydrolase [Heliocybe sulcata]|uniref:glucan endo-1,3-beta-D-glucosidase n=1 Tax=Heliocybe sulcata TaxID=5364 RepID=A0A5C3MWW5_9AGAM|nr:glycoside hydrolase [Heliocybe sulcata]
MSGQTRGYSDLEGPGGNTNWLEKQESRSRRSRWIVIGSILGLIGLIVIGVALGVTLSKKSSSKSSSGSSSGAVNQSDPNDPSTFQKDANLKQSFYGIAYTPEGSQYPACGNSLDQVITDIQLLSQLTTRIRLYGADCNQSALVLEAIKQTKVNMTVWLANYNIPTDNTPYTRQKAAIQSAIETYGTDHIGGVTVGNEYMLNYLNANGATDPNSAVGNQGAALLKTDIDDTRTMLSGMNLATHIPVGTAEAGSYFNTEVLEDVEYGMSNVHPWFANVSIDQAASWTWDFFDQQNVEPAAALSNSPKMYIAETGWPSNSSDAGNESNGPSTASTANLQTFLDTFVCQANQNGTGYFYFEYFDEIWKDQQFGGVEGWWGLFYANRTLKPITIPDCQSP